MVNELRNWVVTVGLILVCAFAISPLASCSEPFDPMADELSAALEKLTALQSRQNEFDSNSNPLNDVLVGATGDELGLLEGDWVTYSADAATLNDGLTYSFESLEFMRISIADRTMTRYSLRTSEGTMAPPLPGLEDGTLLLSVVYQFKTRGPQVLFIKPEQVASRRLTSDGELTQDLGTALSESIVGTDTLFFTYTLSGNTLAICESLEVDGPTAQGESTYSECGSLWRRLTDE